MGMPAMPSDHLANLTVSELKLLEQINQLGASTLLHAALEIEKRLSACEAEIKALKQQKAEG
jgi:hypothetical protein